MTTMTDRTIKEIMNKYNLGNDMNNEIKKETNKYFFLMWLSMTVVQVGVYFLVKALCA